jgi:hypothetical protein
MKRPSRLGQGRRANASPWPSYVYGNGTRMKEQAEVALMPLMRQGGKLYEEGQSDQGGGRDGQQARILYSQWPS